MKEHPVLFSGEMVRAILEGRKTQTRRLIPLPQELASLPFFKSGTELVPRRAHLTFERGALRRCWLSGACWNDEVAAKPRCAVGDTLWVREAWAPWCNPSILCAGCERCDRSHGEYLYRANNPAPQNIDCVIKWRPSIHMPRSASRITLKVTAVRAEMLTQITEADAQAEGYTPVFKEAGGISYIQHTAKEFFEQGWDSLYWKQGFGWSKMPYVWAYTFKEVKK